MSQSMRIVLTAVIAATSLLLNYVAAAETYAAPARYSMPAARLWEMPEVC